MALGRMKDPTVVPALRELVRKDDRQTRIVAIEALGSYGAVEAVPDIIPHLTDLDEKVREAARSALGEIRRLDEEKAEWWAWYKKRESADSPR